MVLDQLAIIKQQLAQQAQTKKENAKIKTPVPKKPIDPILRIIGILQKHYPLAFPKNPHPKVALKVGIHKDLLAQSEQMGIKKIEIRAALKKWCQGKRYAECIVLGAPRVDLQGQPTSQVTQAEIDQAKQFKTARKTTQTEQAEKPDPTEPTL